MKKKIFITLFSILSFVTISKGQQDPQLTQWMFDRMSFNPAFAGIDKMHCLQLFYRTQWTGFENSPQTTLFNYNGHAPLADQTLGFGLSAFSETLGLESNTIMRGSFAYHHTIGAHKIAGGIQLGMLNKVLGTDWKYIDANDPLITDLQKQQSSTVFDAALGLSFYKPDSYYAGVSLTHLNAAALEDLNYEMARHMYVCGGYNYPINTDLVLRSNLLMKTDMKASPAIDVNANVLWKNMLWGGVSYRMTDAVSPMFGFQKVFPQKVSGRTTLDQLFRIGYSYDLTTSEIRNYSTGSHEIFLTYCFNVSQEPIKTYHVNPRFLY